MSAGRKPPQLKVPKNPDKFSVTTLEKLSDDLKSKRVPLDRITVADAMQPGLRAIVRNSGLISFHVNYEIDGVRPYLKLGNHPDMTIPRARDLAKTIRALGALGIDVTEGLHDRLMRELEEKGTKWRP